MYEIIINFLHFIVEETQNVEFAVQTHQTKLFEELVRIAPDSLVRVMKNTKIKYELEYKNGNLTQPKFEKRGVGRNRRTDSHILWKSFLMDAVSNYSKKNNGTDIKITKTWNVLKHRQSRNKVMNGEIKNTANTRILSTLNKSTVSISHEKLSFQHHLTAGKRLMKQLRTPGRSTERSLSLLTYSNRNIFEGHLASMKHLTFNGIDKNFSQILPGKEKRDNMYLYDSNTKDESAIAMKNRTSSNYLCSKFTDKELYSNNQEHYSLIYTNHDNRAYTLTTQSLERGKHVLLVTTHIVPEGFLNKLKSVKDKYMIGQLKIVSHMQMCNNKVMLKHTLERYYITRIHLIYADDATFISASQYGSELRCYTIILEILVKNKDNISIFVHMRKENYPIIVPQNVGQSKYLNITQSNNEKAILYNTNGSPQTFLCQQYTSYSTLGNVIHKSLQLITTSYQNLYKFPLYYGIS